VLVAMLELETQEIQETLVAQEAVVQVETEVVQVVMLGVSIIQTITTATAAAVAEELLEEILEALMAVVTPVVDPVAMVETVALVVMVTLVVKAMLDMKVGTVVVSRITSVKNV
jgi:hypothetical protein